MRKWVRRTYIWHRYLWEVGRKSRNAKKPGRKKREVYIGYNIGYNHGSRGIVEYENRRRSEDRVDIAVFLARKWVRRTIMHAGYL